MYVCMYVYIVWLMNVYAHASVHATMYAEQIHYLKFTG